MTSIAIASPVAPLLLAGRFAIEVDEQALFRQAATLPTLTPAVAASIERLLTLSTHLIPVDSEPPRCETCKGSGTISAALHHYSGLGSGSAATAQYENDNPIQMSGDISAPCPDCKDGLPLHVTLTVECDAPSCYQGELRYRTGVDDYESEPCPKCGSTGYVPVARAHVIEALPIYVVLDQWPSDDDYLRSPSGLLVVGPGSEMVLADDFGNDTTDVSHLLPLASWVPGEWALLVDQVEGL